MTDAATFVPFPSVSQQEQQQNSEEDDPLAVDATSSSTSVPLNYREIQYAVDSFYTIVKPVLCTMVLSALAVVYISTPESSAATEAALSHYNVIDSNGDGSSSNATQLGTSLINGLVIVSAICVMTFVIVLLYKYRCMSFLIGYMILSSTLLLGYLASEMFKVAIDRYELRIDKLTFYVTMYNFAIVGVIAIFGGSGVVPLWTSQAYLILTAVIVAWQLSHFDPWTAWVLLVLLALYDLFAVLTPCGPLKALVHLMQRDDAPPMPGLLYEASLPAATTQQQQQRQQQTAISDNENLPHAPSEASPDDPHRSANRHHQDNIAAAGPTTTRGNRTDNPQQTLEPAASAALVDNISPFEESATINTADDNVSTPETAVLIDDISVEVPLRTGYIPLAVAKLYRLRFRHDPQPPWITDDITVDHDEDEDATEPNASSVSFTPEQLQLLVEVIFPGSGGHIVPTVQLETPAVDLYRRTQATDEPRYTTVDYQGVPRRVLFVNRQGRVFEDLREQVENNNEAHERTSIKLGLGDFIFYSILVSKAALYSYTTFVVCTLAVLSGLGLTLLLLAVYGHALPALPISILLGVVFYLVTRYVMEPWVHAIFVERVYA